jgi:hypothetical protein
MAERARMQNAGNQFTILLGPVSLPFEVAGTTSRIALNGATIWDRDQPDPTLHNIPFDATRPVNLRIMCASP